MKVLVTGYTGQLGKDVLDELNKRNIGCCGTGRVDFDITDFYKTEKFINEYNPDAVIHCAAYTFVDKAEEEKELCRKINSEGTENIAKICEKTGAKLLYISTDYVFDGEKNGEYVTEDETNPINVYGQTKLAGEIAVKKLEKHFIIRTSWVFGENGNNFVKTMLRLSQTKERIGVVADQIGSPTYTKDLAKLICDMIVTDKYGTYQATNEGFCSWAEFAEEIFKIAKKDVKVDYINSSEYPTKAERPKNSRMSKIKLTEMGFQRLPGWKDALNRYLEYYKN